MTQQPFRPHAGVLFVLALLGWLAETPAGSASARFLTAPRSQSVDAGLFAPLEWRSLGPAAMGGRIVDIEVPSQDAYTLYAASASGGLFRSRNCGTTWECIFEYEGTISIGDIALDPRDPQVIWIGTGEANNQRSSYWGDGVYKSIDGGATWTNMGLRDSHHIGRVVVDPQDSEVVWVAALGHLYSANRERGLYRTKDGGKTWDKVLALGEHAGVVDVVVDPQDSQRIFAASYERLRRAWHLDEAGPASAVHRSTDGGETWTRLGGGLPEGEIGRIGLAVSPQDPRVVYATVSNLNPAPEPESEDEPVRLGVRAEAAEGGGLRVTAVSEGSPANAAKLAVGDLMQKAGESEMTAVADLAAAVDAARQGDGKLTLSVRRGYELLAIEVSLNAPRERRPRSASTIGGEIYRSDDGGETWAKQNERPIGGNPPYYYGQIRVDPKDAQTVYVLSIPVYVSRDGGKTWNEDNLAGSVHVDHHALWIDPADSRHLILGNDGGLAVSYDRGATWRHLNNLPLAQFYAVAVDDQMPYHVYGGTQDNGTWMGPSRTRHPRGIGTSAWTNIGGGDGFQVGIDPLDGAIVYLESQFGSLERVDLKTATSQSIRPPASEPEGVPDRYNWMSPLHLSPHGPTTLYLGANKLFQSHDRGATWHVRSPDLTTQDAEKMAGNVPHCTITSIAESPVLPGRWLVGTDDGNVQWSDDSGHSWTNLSGLLSGVPPKRWVSRVAFSSHDAATAYVALTGYREDDFTPYLVRTKDGGLSFESISSDLPRGGINAIVEDPRNPNLLYVGTELGCWCTLDGGTHWFELSRGLPTVAVHDLVVHARDRELVAGTHGRGIYILDIAPLQELTPTVLQESFALLSAAPAVAYRMIFRQGDGFSGDSGHFAANPPAGAGLHYHLRSDQAAGSVKLAILDAAGETVQLFEDLSVTRGLHRVQWGLDRRAEPQAEEAAAERPRFGRRRSSIVPPGAYTALLTVGDQEKRCTVEVLADPLDALRATAPSTRIY